MTMTIGGRKESITIAMGRRKAPITISITIAITMARQGRSRAGEEIGVDVGEGLAEGDLGLPGDVVADVATALRKRTTVRHDFPGRKLASEGNRRMLKMDQIHVVRHQRFVEKRSVRWIARQMGLDRRTVKKYLEESAPERKHPISRAHPLMSVAGPRIDALLEEWEPRLGGKHRLTSVRIHRELDGEGMKIGERTVREYVAEKRRQAAEVFIPLVHRAGEEAQVDFFEVQVD